MKILYLYNLINMQVNYKFLGILLIFLFGMYYYINSYNISINNILVKEDDEKQSEKIQCHNMLIEKDGKILLYNSRKEIKDGSNPIEFSNLDEYKDFIELQKDNNKNCPVLFLQYTTDTQNNGGNFGEVIFNHKRDNELRLGSKVTDPYLRRIEEILALGYKVVFMIRNPIYSIRSWNSVNASKSPLGRVDGENQHRRWNRFGFSNESRLVRHVKIWNYYAEIIKSNSDDCLVIKYEDLVMNVEESVDQISKYLGIKKPAEIPKLVNGNLKYKHEDILSIKEELKKNSKLMFEFGYQES